MFDQNEREVKAVSDDELDGVSGGAGFLPTTKEDVAPGTFVTVRTRAYYLCGKCTQKFDMVVDSGNAIPGEIKCSCGDNLVFTGKTKEGWFV